MALPRIHAEPCDCEIGVCVALGGDDDRGRCVNRLRGEVVVMLCEVCGAGTWHHEGACLACKYRREKAN